MENEKKKFLTADEKRLMLRQIITSYEIPSNADFARRLGVSPQNVSAWFDRGTFNAELLAINFPELSGDWILTGQQPMFRRDRQPTQAEESELNKALDAVKEEQAHAKRVLDQMDNLIKLMSASSKNK